MKILRTAGAFRSPRREGTVSNTAKSTADARIDSKDLAAAEIANMHHMRDFRNPAIFEFFNTIRQKRPFKPVGFLAQSGPGVVPNYSALMLATRITRAHLSVSLMIS
jgi:hypothetical protein